MTKEDRSMFKEEGTPKWLKTIQLNSWEAELLISALLLYALFQVPDFLYKFSLQHFVRGSQMHGLVSIVIMAIRILSAGYILHIIVRGIWVASVGLSYVFPKGVNSSELKFKGKFRKELELNGSLVKMVLKLEELSSIIYGISFIFFGTLIGFGSFLFSFVFFFEWVAPHLKNSWVVATLVGVFMLFYVFLTLIVFIDFLTNGLLRRKNWSADWFYYIAKAFRFVTLSFLYRRSLLVLISNTKGWKKYLIPIIIVAVVGGSIWLKNENKSRVNAMYFNGSAVGNYTTANYETTRHETDFLAATIQSDIVSDNVLRVFLNDLSVFGSIFKLENSTKSKAKWDALPSDSVSRYLNEKLITSIDGKSAEKLRWSKSQHAVNYSFGFTTFIDIDTLERGEHFLKIQVDTVGMKSHLKSRVEKEDYSLETISNIYFFYDK